MAGVWLRGDDRCCTCGGGWRTRRYSRDTQRYPCSGQMDKPPVDAASNDQSALRRQARPAAQPHGICPLRRGAPPDEWPRAAKTARSFSGTLTAPNRRVIVQCGRSPLPSVPPTGPLCDQFLFERVRRHRAGRRPGWVLAVQARSGAVATKPERAGAQARTGPKEKRLPALPLPRRGANKIRVIQGDIRRRSLRT